MDDDGDDKDASKQGNEENGTSEEHKEEALEKTAITKKPFKIHITKMTIPRNETLRIAVISQDTPGWMDLSLGGQALLCVGTTGGVPTIGVLGDFTRPGFDKERCLEEASYKGIPKMALESLFNDVKRAADTQE